MAAPIVRIDIGVRASPEYAEQLGRAMLNIAEDHRREPNGSFDASARANLSPAADWAVAGLLISGAVTVLDESMPNAQRKRTESALGALIVGVAMLRESLRGRGIEPAMILLEVPDAEPPKV